MTFTLQVIYTLHLPMQHLAKWCFTSFRRIWTIFHWFAGRPLEHSALASHCVTGMASFKWMMGPCCLKQGWMLAWALPKSLIPNQEYQRNHYCNYRRVRGKTVGKGRLIWKNEYDWVVEKYTNIHPKYCIFVQEDEEDSVRLILSDL